MRPGRFLGDLLLLAAVSFLSFSKAAFITYAVVYGMAYLLAEGGSARARISQLEVRGDRRHRVSLAWHQVAAARWHARQPGSSAMTQQALSGASARFMGGIFRAYTVAVREVRHGWPPLGGSYHSQAALLVVPRALWPDKPHVASEQLYYLLGVTEEDYGTAFAINLYGCLVFDFGLLGCLIGAAVVGVLLQAGDRAIPSWRELRRASPRGQRWQYFATMWLYLAVPLSEGGIPVAIVSAIGLTGAFVLVQVCNQIVHAILSPRARRRDSKQHESHARFHESFLRHDMQPVNRSIAAPNIGTEGTVQFHPDSRAPGRDEGSTRPSFRRSSPITCWPFSASRSSSPPVRSPG